MALTAATKTSLFTKTILAEWPLADNNEKPRPDGRSRGGPGYGVNATLRYYGANANRGAKVTRGGCRGLDSSTPIWRPLPCSATK